MDARRHRRAAVSADPMLNAVLRFALLDLVHGLLAVIGALSLLCTLRTTQDRIT